MLAPSSSFWLCEILAAVDLLCHVKDERSCLPLSEILPPQFLCSLHPACLATGCLPVWLEDPLLFLSSYFLPSIRIPLEIKHTFMLCQALMYTQHITISHILLDHLIVAVWKRDLLVHDNILFSIMYTQSSVLCLSTNSFECTSSVASVTLK